MSRSTAQYAVTGDFRRLVYSRHSRRELAEAAARRLARKWGWSVVACFEFTLSQRPNWHASCRMWRS